MHVHETCVTSIFNCTCLFVCLFVCKWQQFYMNHKALINRFVWPGLSFCARLNIKPCPDLDLSSRPCHYWLTNNQFFWLNIDIIVTLIRIALVLLLSYSSGWNLQLTRGLAVELWHRLGNSTRTHRKQQSASQRRQWAFVQLGQLERRPLQWH